MAENSPPTVFLDPENRSRWDFSDIARSFGSGMAKGGGGFFGFPGDLRQMIAAGHDRYVRPIEQRLGYQGPSPEAIQQIYAQQPISLTPTSERVAEAIATLVGPPHQPQTQAGDLAYNIGDRISTLPVYALTGARRR